MPVTVLRGCLASELRAHTRSLYYLSFLTLIRVSYSMKPGRIVILLAGRHAGKKAIIVRQHDDGKKVRFGPHSVELSLRSVLFGS